MPQEEPCQLLGIRRDVEMLVRRHARVRASGDVSHRVAAGLAGRQTGAGEFSHRGLDVVEFHEMKLHVLPGRDVAEPARILLADFRHRVQLGRRQQALRDLDPQHLRIFRLPLSVCAANQPECTPLIRRDFAALVLAEHPDEFVDIGLFGKRQPRTAVGGLIIDG